MFSKNKVFAANMDSYPEMMDYIAGFTENFTQKIIFDTTLVCEEILVNIVNYAYPNGDGQLVIAWEEDREQNKFKLSFEDSGIPFNPLICKDPDFSAPIEEREIGGLGILLIRKLTDDVKYTYADGKNRLIITKEY